MLLRAACAVSIFLWAAVGRAEEPRVVIERAIEAKGGEEVLLKSGKTPHSAKLRGHMMTVPMSGESHWQSAGICRETFKLEYGGDPLELGIVIAEGKAWQVGPNRRVKELTEEEMNDIRDLIDHDRAISLVPLLKDKAYSITKQDDVDVDGKPTWAIKAAYKDRPDTLLFFDKRSGLLVKVAFSDRKGKRTEVFFSDYYEIGRALDEKLLHGAELKTDAKSVLAFLNRLTPDQAKIATARGLVRKLGDDSFEVREHAVRDLIELGKVAAPLLQEAKKNSDPEVARGAAECLTQIEKQTNDAVVAAAVRLIGYTHPKGGAEVLLALLPAVDGAVGQDVKAVLVTYAGEKPDPAIVKALEDLDPVRKTAARAVLGKDGGEYLKEPGRTLFVRGPKEPIRYRYETDGKKVVEYEITEYRQVNRHDPSLFAKPAEGN